MQKYFGYTYTKKRGCIIHVCRWKSSIFTRFYLGQDFQIPSQEKEALHQTHKLKRDSFYAVIMGKVNIVNPITYKTFPRNLRRSSEMHNILVTTRQMYDFSFKIYNFSLEYFTSF